jgi:plasmid stability protein
MAEFLLRGMSDASKYDLKIIAKKHKRSLNSEILMVLEKYLESTLKENKEVVNEG